MPRHVTDPMIDRTAANRSGPHRERKPPVTFDYVAAGRPQGRLPGNALAGRNDGRAASAGRPTLPSRRLNWLVIGGMPVVVAREFGAASPSNAFTADTPIPITSLSKAMTAAAVLTLVAYRRI